MPFSNETNRHKRTLVGGSAAGSGGIGGDGANRVEVPPGAGAIDGPLRGPHKRDERLTHVTDEPVIPGTDHDHPSELNGSPFVETDAERSKPHGTQDEPRDPSAGGAGSESPPEGDKKR